MRWMMLACLLVGCTSLTAAGARVRLVGGDSGQGDAGSFSVSGCRYIGPITAYARSTRPGSSLTGNFAIARTNARNDARNKAAKAGADTLVELKTDDDTFGVTATGKAYDCKTGHSPEGGEHDAG